MTGTSLIAHSPCGRTLVFRLDAKSKPSQSFRVGLFVTVISRIITANRTPKQTKGLML
jgi:hypothetical protein